MSNAAASLRILALTILVNGAEDAGVPDRVIDHAHALLGKMEDRIEAGDEMTGVDVNALEALSAKLTAYRR